MIMEIFTRVGAVILLAALFGGSALSQNTPEGISWVRSHGYTGCIRLFNASTQVILEPNCGGRVIDYSIHGQNVLYEDPQQDGWLYSPGEKWIEPCGGRFDIGPEMTIKQHPDLWLGKWTGEITGPRSARLTSIEDEATGVRLIREFTLDSNSSHLSCTQIIRNVSAETKYYYHWSRTFAEGNGIFIVPLNPESRFPKGYIVFGPGPVMDYSPPDHPSITVRDGFLQVFGPPPQPQLALDSYDGWLAYLTRSNLLFVKKFPMYPDRVYSDMAATTVVIWYYKDMMCELEPMGPRETLTPGESASYTEDWWLEDYRYPREGSEVDLEDVQNRVRGKNR